MLSAKGDFCAIVKKGARFARLEKHHYTIDPNEPEAYEMLIQDIVDGAAKPIDGIVYLWGLDAGKNRAERTEGSDFAQTFGCGELLLLVQTVSRRETTTTPRLWIITRGAQHAGSGSVLNDPADPLQASLWGLGRVIALENPDLRTIIVDLDPDENNDPAMDIANELEITSGEVYTTHISENQIAYRKGQRLGARLVAVSVGSTNKNEGMEKASERLFDPDVSYLITGGFGGLGRLTVEWMVQHGARHLIVTGRTGHNKESVKLFAELEEIGARFSTFNIDISNPLEVEKMLSLIAGEQPPLKGIFHCAGVLSDSVLSQQSPESFAYAMAPKAVGAWNLHQSTAKLNLDYFVLYSSWAGAIGSAGQGNHSAANACMDALAHHRRSLGLSAATINWGPWIGAGAASSSEISQQLSSRGIDGFSVEEGFKALRRLLLSNHTQEIFLPFDLKRWQQTYPATETALFFSLICESDDNKSQSKEAENKYDDGVYQAIVASGDSLHKKTLVHDLLKNQIAGILRKSPSGLDTHRSFKDMGLDSLTGLELCNQLNMRLQIRLPATAIWNYPTIDLLSRRILQIVESQKEDGQAEAESAGAGIKSSADSPAYAEIADIIDELDDMTDEEVRRMLSSDSSTPGVSDE